MKILKIISFSLFFLAFPAVVFAINADGFTMTYGNEKILIDQATINSWQGEEVIEAEKIFTPPQENLSTLMLGYIGLTDVKPAVVLVYHHRLSEIYNYLRQLSKKINTNSEEPALDIKQNRAVAFSPGQTGKELDVYTSSFDTIRALELGKNKLELTVLEAAPKGSLSQTNELGINELVAEGVSTFSGSPKNRRHNIAVGVEKFKGIIIAQGEEFSFNKYLGSVDAENGFLPELVIKGKEGTILEFGGGLCQVSSTTFRAAMQAGLPITARRNHAYAVQYYAPQGTDATIYPGSADLKFINDTPGAILVWPYEKDANTLIFDFYGTKDSRQVTLEKPVQYDRKPDGSMKATWTRDVVTALGEKRTDVFKSVYQPPALFHKAEQFVGVPISSATSGIKAQ